MTVIEVIERAAAVDRWWQDRRNRGRAAAAYLQRHGVGYDDRVALAHVHADALIDVLIGCWMVGAIPALIDPRSDPQPFLDDAEPAIVVDHLTAATRSNGRVDGDPGPDSGVFLSWTSGTTGKPKGVVVDSGPIALGTSCIADRLRLRSDDVILCATPAASSFQLVAALLPAAHAACRFVPAEGLRADELWTKAVDVGATVLVAYPLTLAEFVAAAPSSGSRLRLALSGGSPLAPRIKRDYRDRLGIPITESYGQSELGGFAALGDPLDADPRAMTHIGRSLPDRRAWTGDGGEIVVAGRVMRGYWRRAEADAAMLRPPGLHTGDIGVSDRDGYLRILGRRSDRLPDGRWPREIEDELYDLPATLHAAVVSAGDHAIAIVQAGPQQSLSPGEVQEVARVDEARVVDEMPRTFSGKVHKIQLARELARESAR